MAEEIGINFQKLSDGSLEAESQLPQLFHRTPSPSEAGINIQMTAVDEAGAPSEDTIILHVAVAGGDETGRDPPSPLLAVRSVAQSDSETRGISEMLLSEARAISRRWLDSFMFNPFDDAGAIRKAFPVPPPETGTRSNAFPVSGDGRAPPSAEISIFLEGGDGVNRDTPLLPPETGVRFNAFSISDAGGRPPANGEPLLPAAVKRFMRFRVYASIPAISGTCIHVLASMMEPTTENKKLIGVSMMSLIGNLVASTWMIFRGGDLPNDDWKNNSFKIAFVFTGTLTFYASFSTLAANLFTLPGIALCGALAVGLGHSDGLTRLYKKFF